MSLTLKTSHGDLKIELACHEVPKSSRNFLALCASGYYNGCKFHRNIKGFAIQGGDPTGTGKGGESIYGKYLPDEFDTTLKHDRRGIVSMANQGSPNTNGSQFFITYARQPHLNGTYSVIGRVIDGLDTLERMEKGSSPFSSQYYVATYATKNNVEPVGKKHRPIRDIVIERIVIHSNPIAEEDSLHPSSST